MSFNKSKVATFARRARGGVSKVRDAMTWSMAALAVFVVEPAMAALPAAVNPATGAAPGDYMQLLQQYWKQGIAVLVLMFGSYAFLEVGGGAIAKFGEWRIGKAELSELKWFFFIGVVMLVTVVYLLTTANGIL